MIAHVLRLTIGEWLKIRRRWIHWILLGLIVLISQVILWGSYVGHHSSDDPFGTLIPPYEYNDTEGSIVVTCNDVVEGRAEEKFALISGKLVGEEREKAGAEAVEWRKSCEGYLTPGEAQRPFTLPYSVGDWTGWALAVFVIPILILTASVMGIEYGLGTLRTTLARGVGRWQLLSGKLIMLMGAVVAAVVGIGVLIGIASLLAGVIPPAEEESLIVNDGGAWLDAVRGPAKLVFALAPYVALGVFLTVLTQSTAQGISLSMGYYVIELILAPVLGGLADWLEKVLDIALLGKNATEWMSTASTTEAQQALGTVVGQPDTIRGLLHLAGVHGGLGCRRTLGLPAQRRHRRKGGVTQPTEIA